MTIRNRLAELMAEKYTRTGRRLSQEDLAQATGVAQSTISAYVTNQVRRYDISVVSRLINYFGISVSEFFVEIPSEDSDEGQWVPVLNEAAV